MTNSIQEIRNKIGSGKCEGTINEVEVFKAYLVELTEEKNDAQGQVYQLYARHRIITPKPVMKELVLTFSKGSPNGNYPVIPGSKDVIVTFVDYSESDGAVIYTQQSGSADINFDDEAGVLSGKLTNVILTNQNDDVLKEITLHIDFEAKGDINRLRRGTPCAA